MGMLRLDHVGVVVDDLDAVAAFFLESSARAKRWSRARLWTRSTGSTASERALAQADEAAGDDAVCVMGGTETVQQYLEAGLIDEVCIHLVPVLLGDGIRLFETIDPAQIELEPSRVVESPEVTHLWYSVVE